MAESTYLSFYLRCDTIYIFCGALRKMGRSAYVRFLINADTMQMIMQSYHKKEFTSFRVPKTLYMDLPGKHNSLRIRSRAFCRLLAARMGWDVDKTYRVPGIVYSKCHMVRFDLVKAVERSP